MARNYQLADNWSTVSNELVCESKCIGGIFYEPTTGEILFIWCDNSEGIFVPELLETHTESSYFCFQNSKDNRTEKCVSFSVRKAIVSKDGYGRWVVAFPHWSNSFYRIVLKVSFVLERPISP